MKIVKNIVKQKVELNLLDSPIVVYLYLVVDENLVYIIICPFLIVKNYIFHIDMKN